MLLQYLKPEDVDVVVVEDDAGEVMASLAVMRVVHLEGLWIDPAAKNAGVARGLLREAVRVAEKWCSSGWVFGGAADDRMRDLLERLGGARVPMDTYALHLARRK